VVSASAATWGARREERRWRRTVYPSPARLDGAKSSLRSPSSLAAATGASERRAAAEGAARRARAGSDARRCGPRGGRGSRQARGARQHAPITPQAPATRRSKRPSAPRRALTTRATNAQPQAGSTGAPPPPLAPPRRTHRRGQDVLHGGLHAAWRD
jgi:hypothetical protein